VKHAKSEKRLLSFARLSFDETITDILKIKPEPKPPKPKREPTVKSSKRA